MSVLNITKFLRVRNFSSGKTAKLGEGLGIPKGIIDQFHKQSHDDLDDMLSDVISYWLRNDRHKSWDKVADALEHCREDLLADEIRGRPPANKGLRETGKNKEIT